MTKLATTIAIMLALASGCLCQAAKAGEASATISLATNGQTAYVIALAKDHSKPEKHAANELARFLKQVTGAEFAIVAAEERGKRPVIAVGPGAARQIAPNLDLAGLGQDGIVIQSQLPDLILTGGPGAPRGTLYAVFTFLEDSVGCHWWTKDESSIPHRATLFIAEFKHRHVPTLEHREPYSFVAFDRDWNVRNKCDSSITGHYPYSNRPTLDEDRGGNGIRYIGSGCHTFNALVPPAEFFPKHPEWFAEIGGRRMGPPATTTMQWCLTNPELLTFCIQQVKAMLRGAPPESMVSVSQNDDTTYRCQCAKCMAIEKEEGSPSGPLLRFVNAVADAVKAEYPRAVIDTLAYTYTRKPPRVTKARPNVSVWLCSSGRSNTHPLEHERNRDFAEDVKGWAAVCQRLHIWDYALVYWAPFPNLRTLGPDIRFFAKHNVKGVFIQGNYVSPGGAFVGLEAWVQAKLLWNPAADDCALIQQYVEGYYGAAAPYIAEYIQRLHDTAEKTDYAMRCNAEVDAPYLTVGLLTEAERLFQKAELAVKDSPELLRRVRLEHGCIQYVVLGAWPTLKQEAQANGQPWVFGATPVNVLNCFMDVCRANNVTMLEENRLATPESFRRKLELITGPHAGVTPPEMCKKLPDADWVDFQEDRFPISQPQGETRSDPMASNGKANWMPSTHREWSIGLQLPISLWIDRADQEWTAYVVVRVEKKGKGEGTAFSYGMYDTKQSKHVGGQEKIVALSQIKNDSYHVYEVATSGLSYGRFVWLAPTENKDNVAGIWVDRIFMVRKPPVTKK